LEKAHIIKDNADNNSIKPYKEFIMPAAKKTEKKAAAKKAAPKKTAAKKATPKK